MRLARPQCAGDACVKGYSRVSPESMARPKDEAQSQGTRRPRPERTIPLQGSAHFSSAAPEEGSPGSSQTTSLSPVAARNSGRASCARRRSRGMRWKLYGKATLTGADAIVRLACVGDPLYARVAGSVIRNRHLVAKRATRVLVQVSGAWPRFPGAA